MLRERFFIPKDSLNILKKIKKENKLLIDLPETQLLNIVLKDYIKNHYDTRRKYSGYFKKIDHINDNSNRLKAYNY